MIRIACCDDAVDVLQKIKDSLDSWNSPSFNVSTEIFIDGDTLIKAHSSSPFDIIVLDVVMPLLNGMQTAREIRAKDKNVKIIFLSTTSEYAFEAYSVKASNYLLKPYNPNQLIQCIEELITEMREVSRSISIGSTGRMHRVFLSEIEMVEAQNKHVMFTLKNGRKIVSTQALYFYEKDLLNEVDFFKCHRSYVINLFQVASYTSKEITMRSGVKIPVSRNLYKEFESAYFSVLFNKAGDFDD